METIQETHEANEKSNEINIGSKYKFILEERKVFEHLGSMIRNNQKKELTKSVTIGDFKDYLKAKPEPPKESSLEGFKRFRITRPVNYIQMNIKQAKQGVRKTSEEGIFKETIADLPKRAPVQPIKSSRVLDGMIKKHSNNEQTQNNSSQIQPPTVAALKGKLRRSQSEDLLAENKLSKQQPKPFQSSTSQLTEMENQPKCNRIPNIPRPYPKKHPVDMRKEIEAEIELKMKLPRFRKSLIKGKPRYVSSSFDFEIINPAVALRSDLIKLKDKLRPLQETSNDKFERLQEVKEKRREECLEKGEKFVLRMAAARQENQKLMDEFKAVVEEPVDGVTTYMNKQKLQNMPIRVHGKKQSIVTFNC